MKPAGIVVLFLCALLVRANDDERPMLWTSLDWSSDGRYIAVTTDKGVHIHNSDDLSLYRVLAEYNYGAIKWSNKGLRLAVNSNESWGISIWDHESEEETHLTVSEEQGKTFFTIEWAHGDATIAATGTDGIYLGDIESQRFGRKVTFRSFYDYGPGHTWMQWRPPLRVDILSPMVNGIAIFNYYTGFLVDFIWNSSGNNPARWSPDGNMIAAGDGPVTVWQVLPDSQVTAWAEIGGERIHRLDYERGSLWGLSWHPDSTKLAFIFSHAESGYPPESDFSRDGALIWDITANTTKLIPGVFLIDTYPAYKAIEWNPDGSMLAAISSDGRIVIWETDTYQIIAEYDGYRSVLDW